MTGTGSYLIFIIIAYVTMMLPLFKLPVDDHFADYFSWALFRRPGQKLPRYFVWLNQGGFSRLYMHHLGTLFTKLFSRCRVLVGYRCFQLSLYCLAALGIFGTSTNLFGVAPPLAMAAALLFSFTVTRPQFDLIKLNPEPVYGLLSLMCFWWLGYLIESKASVWSYSLPLGVLCFSGLHNKVLFCLDCLAVTSVLILTSEFEPLLIVSASFAFLAAFWLFAVCIGGVGKQNLLSLWGYGACFSENRNIWDNFVFNYKAYMNRTPLAALSFLALVGAVAAPQSAPKAILLAWALSSTIVLIFQRRFCSYFFLTIFPPFSLLAALGLQAAFHTHPICATGALGIAAFLSRKAIIEFPYYYLKKSISEFIIRAFGSCWTVSSFELRLGKLLEHQKRHSGSFIIWNSSHQLHYLTDTAPITQSLTMVQASYAMWPEKMTLITKEARIKKPEWVYDFSGLILGLHRFNPLTFFMATGLLYAPEERIDNILCFKLFCHDERSFPSKKWKYYTEQSICADLLCGEMGHLPAWRSAIELPDISEVLKACFSADLPRPSMPDNIPDPIERSQAPQISLLYQAGIRFLSHDLDAARRAFVQWEKSSFLLTKAYPPLAVYGYFFAQLVNAPTELKLPTPLFERLHPRDAMFVGQFIYQVCLSDRVSADMTALAEKVAQTISVDTGPYAYCEWPSIMGIHEAVMNELNKRAK